MSRGADALLFFCGCIWYNITMKLYLESSFEPVFVNDQGKVIEIFEADQITREGLEGMVSVLLASGVELYDLNGLRARTLAELPRVPTICEEQDGIEALLAHAPALLTQAPRLERLPVAEGKHAAAVKRLCTLADTLGLDEGALDENVHDTAAGLGSDANNSGVSGQLRFLLEQGWSESEVADQLRGLAEDE